MQSPVKNGKSTRAGALLSTDRCVHMWAPRVRTSDYQGVLQYVFSHPGGTSSRAGQIMDRGPWHAHTFIPLSSQEAVNTEARAPGEVGGSPVHYHCRCHMLIVRSGANTWREGTDTQGQHKQRVRLPDANPITHWSFWVLGQTTSISLLIISKINYPELTNKTRVGMNTNKKHVDLLLVS